MARSFSTGAGSLNGHIIDDSIFMPAHQPAKLIIPVGAETRYEFTVRPAENISDFEKRVIENCNEIKDFKILAEEQSLGDLAKDSFKIKINSNHYKVYPDFESVMKSNLHVDDPLRTKTDALKE